MMNRNESTTDRIATIIQEGHTAKLSSFEVAQRVVRLVEDEGYATWRTITPGSWRCESCGKAMNGESPVCFCPECELIQSK